MMNLLRLISRPTASAPVARERLQILLARDADCAVNLICLGYYVRRFLL